MDQKMLEEFRRAAGLEGSRYPDYRLDEKKATGAKLDLKATVAQLDHDFNDLRNGMQRVASLGGDWTDQERSAISRLRADLAVVEIAIKNWGTPAKAAKLPAGADPAFVEAFPKNMMLKGQWTRSIGEWQATMHAAIQANNAADLPPEERDPKDDTYNEFKAERVAKWLTKWSGEIEVQPAREYSVALYIKGPADVLAAMQKAAKRGTKADDFDLQADGTLRLWWD